MTHMKLMKAIGKPVRNYIHTYLTYLPYVYNWVGAQKR